MPLCCAPLCSYMAGGEDTAGGGLQDVDWLYQKWL